MRADFTVKAGLLGDSIIPQPALSAAGAANPCGFVNVFVGTEAVRPLWEGNPHAWEGDPHVRLVDEPGGVVLDTSDAFWWASSRDRYFGDGYFPQVGLPAPERSQYFKLHGYHPQPMDSIVICPFSGASGATGNKTPPVEWWNELVSGYLRDLTKKLDLSIPMITLGSKYDPVITGATAVRGASLKGSVSRMLDARLLITVETFACHAAGSKEIGHTLYLNAATPPSLCAGMNTTVYRGPDDKPANWDMKTIAEMTRSLLMETIQR
jgi:hypothetical protein